MMSTHIKRSSDYTVERVFHGQFSTDHRDKQSKTHSKGKAHEDQEGSLKQTLSLLFAKQGGSLISLKRSGGLSELKGSETDMV